MENLIQNLFQDRESYLLINSDEEYYKVTEKIQEYCDKRGIKVAWCSGTSIKRKVFGDIKNGSRVVIHIAKSNKNRYEFTYEHILEHINLKKCEPELLFTATDILTGKKNDNIHKCITCINKEICYNSPMKK